MKRSGLIKRTLLPALVALALLYAGAGAATSEDPLQALLAGEFLDGSQDLPATFFPCSASVARPVERVGETILVCRVEDPRGVDLPENSLEHDRILQEFVGKTAMEVRSRDGLFHDLPAESC